MSPASYRTCLVQPSPICVCTLHWIAQSSYAFAPYYAPPLLSSFRFRTFARDRSNSAAVCRSLLEASPRMGITVQKDTNSDLHTLPYPWPSFHCAPIIIQLLQIWCPFVHHRPRSVRELPFFFLFLEWFWKVHLQWQCDAQTPFSMQLCILDAQKKKF